MSNPEHVCRRTRELPALLLGELTREQRANLEQHVASCPVCAAQQWAMEDVCARLRAASDTPPAWPLAPAVLTRLDVLRAGERRAVVWRYAAAAAALVIGMGVLGVFWQVRRAELFDLAAALPQPARLKWSVVADRAEPLDPAAAMAQALGWLERTQSEDGHWDAPRWGAQAGYTVGLTALALLALMEEDNAPPSPVVKRGLAFLAAQQSPSGQLGPSNSGTMYNHGLATLVLLEAVAREPDGAWRSTAQRAVDFIVQEQRSSGGWDYTRRLRGAGNTSITIWQLQALLRADVLGFADLSSPIAQGLAWLNARIGEDGRVGYRRPADFPSGSETLTAAGALCLLQAHADAGDERIKRMLAAIRGSVAPEDSIDYYRAYFVQAALGAAGTQDADLGHLSNAVLALQSRTGELAGSWEPADRWSLAGGRVYATAMAILALRAS